MPNSAYRGFTLIEVSIVLIIIGLLAGGILGARELIAAAKIRKQITQIENYNIAANTFRGKYNGPPGDLRADEADKFGFAPRTGEQGHGDGNGILQPCDMAISMVREHPIGCENLLFWGDLSIAKLINEDFSANEDTDMITSSFVETLSFNPSALFNEAAIIATSDANSRNVYLISMKYTDGTHHASGPALNIMQAYNIDTKIDDGLATTGRMLSTTPVVPANAPAQGYLVRIGQTQPCYVVATGRYNTAHAQANKYPLCYTSIVMTAIN